ncbi:hypothetical protein [Sulfobacillus thermosulfidooxidans]|uniref:hypothetical protein n=1 Tax=Sulfobacillus thermosulfidooxidans TaxID=28034 RepID=UPI0006B69746|nr:hypothetical protein [Sulfobacillus thermosulfidooxidans]
MLYQFFGSGVGPIIHDGLLAFAVVAYGLGAKYLWLKATWGARGLYGLGGIILVYYELHMNWIWFVLGFAAIGIAVGLMPQRTWKDSQRKFPNSSDSDADLGHSTKNTLSKERM